MIESTLAPVDDSDHAAGAMDPAANTAAICAATRIGTRRRIAGWRRFEQAGSVDGVRLPDRQADFCDEPRGAPSALRRPREPIVYDLRRCAVLQAICDAIHKRRRLRLSYGGGERVVEPYVYGASETHSLLRAYQVSGFSPSRASGWKLFRVEEVTDVTMLDETFKEPRPGYMRNDPCFDVVYCEI
jgi:hypothetical protein